MPHHTTGLPKLDPEPFDATPLWEAARAQRSESVSPPRLGLRVLVLSASVVAALGAVGAAIAVLL